MKTKTSQNHCIERSKPVVNKLKNPNTGSRSGKDVIAGKNIRKDENGIEVFEDYLTDEDESEQTLSTSFLKNSSTLSSIPMPSVMTNFILLKDGDDFSKVLTSSPLLMNNPSSHRQGVRFPSFHLVSPPQKVTRNKHSQHFSLLKEINENPSGFSSPESTNSLVLSKQLTPLQNISCATIAQGENCCEQSLTPVSRRNPKNKMSVLDKKENNSSREIISACKMTRLKNDTNNKHLATMKKLPALSDESSEDDSEVFTIFPIHQKFSLQPFQNTSRKKHGKQEIARRNKKISSAHTTGISLQNFLALSKSSGTNKLKDEASKDQCEVNTSAENITSSKKKDEKNTKHVSSQTSLRKCRKRNANLSSEDTFNYENKIEPSECSKKEVSLSQIEVMTSLNDVTENDDGLLIDENNFGVSDNEQKKTRKKSGLLSNALRNCATSSPMSITNAAKSDETKQKIKKPNRGKSRNKRCETIHRSRKSIVTRSPIKNGKNETGSSTRNVCRDPTTTANEKERSEKYVIKSIKRKKPVLINPEPHQEGFRRSKRIRVPPLESWRNERIRYKYDDEMGVFGIDGIESPPQTTPIKRNKCQPRRKKGLNCSLSPEAPLPFKSNVSSTPLPDVSVFDYETNGLVKIDCVSDFCGGTYYGPHGNPATEDDSVLMCQFFHPPEFTAGNLILKAYSEKPSQNTSNCFLYFKIEQGCITATINDTGMSLSKGKLFYIPPGNRYSLRNNEDKPASLSYVQIGVSSKK